MDRPLAMGIRARTLLLAAALLTGFAVLAAAPPAPEANPPAPPASAPQPATPPAPRPAAAPAQTPATPPAANSSATPGPSSPSPQRFVPTEQVRADFDVSFPIDI